MNTTIRNFFTILFTAGVFIGVLILAVDSLSAHSQAQLQTGAQDVSDQVVEASLAQPSNQITADEENSSIGAVFGLASKMGVVALIIMLVFVAQMGFAWLFRKPAQATRW